MAAYMKSSIKLSEIANAMHPVGRAASGRRSGVKFADGIEVVAQLAVPQAKAA